MKNKNQPLNFKRVIIFAGLLFILALIINLLSFKIKKDERKSQLVIDAIQSHEFLSGELYHVIYGLEGDFSFFEKSISKVIKKRSPGDVNTLLDFLDTHPHYFKVRLIDLQGREIFKLLPDSNTQKYFEEKNFFDLSDQHYFDELKNVEKNVFYFSSMDANVIDGKVETPIRPTIRVAKRVVRENGEENILIANIDGRKILELFEEASNDQSINKVLIDSTGKYIASFPELPIDRYTLNKASIDGTIIKSLQRGVDFENVIENNNKIYVYTKLPLPKSKESWFLITEVPLSWFNGLLKTHFLNWFFWESILIFLLSLWFWRDEKKRHREEVVQVLLNERSEFIQNVSHQLKTPLTIIYNDLVSNEKFELKKNDITREVQHLIKVVENLLLLSQIDALKVLPMKRENTFEVLSESIDLIALKAREKKVSIKVNLDEQLIDHLYLLERFSLPELLKSAFVNILDNAVDFSPEGGSIEIDISYKNDHTIIKIQDHGPGVNPQFAPHIFARFARDRANERKGSGLGLAISKKIIDLHEGKIELVKSNDGTCFQISL